MGIICAYLQKKRGAIIYMAKFCIAYSFNYIIYFIIIPPLIKYIKHNVLHVL
jgi:hypothetical protein